MKYIRTKDGRIAEIKEYMIVRVCDDATRLVYKKRPYICVLNGDDDILKQADTIEELCDEFILVAPYRFRKPKTATELEKELYEMINFYTDKDDKIYGAIWTEWGLKYVAKLNDKGELELL